MKRRLGLKSNLTITRTCTASCDRDLKRQSSWIEKTRQFVDPLGALTTEMAGEGLAGNLRCGFGPELSFLDHSKGIAAFLKARQ